jgi:hypothetical protein
LRLDPQAGKLSFTPSSHACFASKRIDFLLCPVLNKIGHGHWHRYLNVKFKVQMDIDSSQHDTGSCIKMNGFGIESTTDPREGGLAPIFSQ